MKKNRLKARIVERYGSLTRFANEVGLSIQTVSNVVNGNRVPTGITLIGWCAALGIEQDEAAAFFGPETLEN